MLTEGCRCRFREGFVAMDSSQMPPGAEGETYSDYLLGSDRCQAGGLKRLPQFQPSRPHSTRVRH
jgi:hypothetical protein